ncbi:hypothetical protein [Candidatus Amarobacter glycogenicus]|uniref:hypothetical protein n=1 Tax=Candidatus Amarobacter glycogenicus TaxID=3140699 RepID=UPI0031CC8B59
MLVDDDDDPVRDASRLDDDAILARRVPRGAKSLSIGNSNPSSFFHAACAHTPSLEITTGRASWLANSSLFFSISGIWLLQAGENAAGTKLITTAFLPS